MTILSILLGLLLILVVLAEAFEALVLPRRVTRPYRLSHLYYRAGWGLWTLLASLVPIKTRPNWLSLFGPLSLLVLFSLWAAGLVLGFAFLQSAASDLPFGDALYFSGVTFTTLGYGDVVPVGSLGRFLAVLEAASGFGYFAVVIGYLPVLYQAFSKRETLISMLDARAGSPPAAGRLLSRLGTGDAFIRFMERAEEWSAELLESHLSYPVLGYYRSQHDNQSWVAALACILDSCALVLATNRNPSPQVRLTFAMARHAIVDLALVLRRPPATGGDRLPPARLEALRQELKSECRDDCGRALAELRALYEPAAVALAEHFRYALPDIWPEEEKADNWRTSAWLGRAAPLGSLGDDHFT